MTQTVGEQIKQARMRRGLTLAQLSRETHVREQYLEALENDRREDLPSKVQGRGFLRLVAGTLGLPAGPLLAAWDGAPTAETDASASTAPAIDTTAAPPQTVTAEPTVEIQETAAPSSPSEPLPWEQPKSELERSEPLPPVFYHSGPPIADDAPSRAIFREIGQKLRDQRAGLGLSLAEVERYTRLRTHYIQALEEGRLEDLPSPVQGRGMLSNYAAFLNMDEESILLRFADGLQARRVERLPAPEPQGMQQQKKRPPRQAPFWKRFLTPDLIFGVGVAAIILFFALWTVSRISAERSAQAVPPPPPISEVLLTPDRFTRTPGAPGTAQGVLPEAVTPSAGGGSGETPAAPPEAASGAGLPGVEVATATAGTPTLPPMNRDPLQVYIVSRQRAWLRVVTDGNVAFLGRTVPGNAYAFSGSQRVELSTGNAAALQVFFNQNDLGILGISGEVSNLVFTMQGIATPTPMFTTTATATPPATVTPLPSPTAPATPTITPFIP